MPFLLTHSLYSNLLHGTEHANTPGIEEVNVTKNCLEHFIIYMKLMLPNDYIIINFIFGEETIGAGTQNIKMDKFMYIKTKK